MRQVLFRSVVFATIIAAVSAAAAVLAENVDPSSVDAQYAWGENVGWINAEPSGDFGPGATVSGAGVTGYMWGENIGWINLSCANNGTCGSADFGVTNDGTGNLSGYAWGENIGWISFSCANNPSSCATTGSYGVHVDPTTGVWNGKAWGENVGWINFDHTQAAYRITTDDGDGVPGGFLTDNCPFDANSSQENTDAAALPSGPLVPGDDTTIMNGDLLGDACDRDDDNDGLLDDVETTGASPCASASSTTGSTLIDSDGDHLTDGWECENGSDPADAASRYFGSSGADLDGDHIPDVWERRGYGVTTSSTDSDADGCADLVELASIDGNKFVNGIDRLAVARRALGIWVGNPDQDHVLDLDKNGSVGGTDRLFVARAELLPDWLPKSCP